MRRRHSSQVVDRHWGVPTPLRSRIRFVLLIQTLAVAEHLRPVRPSLPSSGRRYAG